MTVGELKRHLEAYADDLPVVLRDDEQGICTFTRTAAPNIHEVKVITYPGNDFVAGYNTEGGIHDSGDEKLRQKALVLEIPGF